MVVLGGAGTDGFDVVGCHEAIGSVGGLGAGGQGFGERGQKPLGGRSVRNQHGSQGDIGLCGGDVEGVDVGVSAQRPQLCTRPVDLRECDLVGLVDVGPLGDDILHSV